MVLSCTVSEIEDILITTTTTTLQTDDERLLVTAVSVFL